VVGPFHYYKKNKLVHLQLYQPNNYPEVLAKFSEQLKYLEILSDTFSLNVFFNNKGRIKSIGYMIDKCTYHGSWLFFVGKSQYPSSLTEFQNNIRNGKYIFYDRNGLPAISDQYKSDKKIGAWEWSHDGKIVFTDYWFDGKKIKTIR
jgi:antitoxin component YwqK of YwqJK toxin-antitoxin module